MNDKNTIYTIQEIAQIISDKQDQASVDKVKRQIRYWTSENLLSPIDGKRTGKGNHRRYLVEEIYKAALIRELDQYHLTSLMIEMLIVADAMGDSYSKDTKWTQAIKNEKDIALIFSMKKRKNGENTPMFYLSELNEGALLKELQSGNAFDDEDGEYSSSIIINLTKIFRRIKIP